MCAFANASNFKNTVKSSCFSRSGIRSHFFTKCFSFQLLYHLFVKLTLHKSCWRNIFLKLLLKLKKSLSIIIVFSAFINDYITLKIFAFASIAFSSIESDEWCTLFPTPNLLWSYWRMGDLSAVFRLIQAKKIKCDIFADKSENDAKVPF